VIGTLIDGKYEITDEIGAGAMGKVYACVHRATGRQLALKVVLDPRMAERPEALARFRREARTAGSAATKHVVEIVDAGIDEGRGLPYLAMERMRGEDASELINRVGPLPVETALKIAAQACLGLAKAHAAGVVHRDVKPANLFLDRQDDGEVVVKVVDFGVAKASVAEPGGHDLTQTGSMLGSPLYMSPEQARGAKAVDARADIWSLGVVLYQLLSGQTPFGHAQALAELLLLICTQPAPPLRKVAPWVPSATAAVVQRSLEMDPARRPQSCDAMREALAVALRSWGGDDDLRLTVADLRALTPGERQVAPSVAPAPETPGLGEPTTAGLAHSRVEDRNGRPWLGFVAAVVVMAGVGLFVTQRASAPAAAEAPSIETPAGPLVVVGDSFSGYATFRARERFAAEGPSALVYRDVPEPAARSRMLAGGEVDLMLISLDQHLRQGGQGKIVALIDTSDGADAIVVKGELPGPDEAPAPLIVAPGTPSEFLAQILDARFDSFAMHDYRIHPVAGSAEAFRALDHHQGPAVAVLWEPYVTRAKEAGHQIMLSSKDVPEAVVDVLVASDRALAERGEAVEAVVGRYYRAVDGFVLEPHTLLEQIALDGGLPPAEAGTIRDGIHFIGALEAKRWLDEGRLAARIEATGTVLELVDALEATPEATSLIAGGPILAAAAQTERRIDALDPALAAKLRKGDLRDAPEAAPSPPKLTSDDVRGAARLGFVGELRPPSRGEPDPAALDRVRDRIADFNPATTVVVLDVFDSDRHAARRRGQTIAGLLTERGVRQPVVVASVHAKAAAAAVRVRISLVRRP